MAGLPRPDLDPGAHRDLVEALHDLHHRAGWPSLRTLGKAAACSPTTVSAVFSSPKLPTWGILELLVEAMDGDAEEFQRLWLAASSPADADQVPVDTQIAGRQDDLAAVRRHLESGTGLLLVTGEAGMGKTRLMSTAAARATGVLVGTGHCLPRSVQMSFVPLADALRDLVRKAGPELVAQALASCPPFTAGSLSRLLPELATAADAADPDDDWARHRLFVAFGELLEALGQLRPTALVVEDLHWADGSTLDLIEHMQARVRSVPMLGTWRTDDPTISGEPQEWRLRVRRLATTSELQLRPLSEDETRQQLQLMGAGNLSPAQAADIYRRSRGQPLYTEQLAAHGHEGRSLPPLLGDLLDQRLAELGGAAWEVVGALAIAQRDLPETILHRAVAIDEAIVGENLRVLTGQRLVASTDVGTVRLSHPLLAEAVRRRLLPSEAAQTSRRLAETLESADWASPGEIAALWEIAGDPTHELDWRIRAAKLAQRQGALPVAAGHWTRVLDLWPAGQASAGDPPTARYDAYAAAMDTLLATGRLSEEESVLERAMAESEAFDDGQEADLLRHAARAAGRRQERDRALALLDRALELYRAQPPTLGLVEALDERANQLTFLGRDTDALASLDEASAALAVLPERPRRHEALLAWQEAAVGRLAAALDRIVAATPPQSNQPEPVVDMIVSMLHSDILLMSCRPPEEVQAAAALGLESARRWQLEAPTRATTLINVSWAWRRAGRLDRAVAWLEDDEFAASESGARLLEIEWSGIDIEAGRLDRARERLRAVPEEHLFQPSGIGLEGLVDVWLGEPEAALVKLRRVLGDEGAETSPGEVGGQLVLAARAAADAAAGSRAGLAVRRALAEELDELHRQLRRDPFGPTAVPADLCELPAWRAELARLGRRDTSEQWLDAAATYDGVGRPHDAAYCRWRAARLALRQGQGTLAQRLLTRAARDARQHVPLSRAIAKTAENPQVG